MYTQLQLKKLLEIEEQRTEKLLTRLEKRKNELPAGSLYAKDKYACRIYYENGKQRQVAIPEDFEDGRLLIEELQEKRYIAKAIPILKSNLKSCRRYLENFRLYDPDEMKKQLPRVYGGFDCSGLRLAGDIDPHIWAETDYDRNMTFAENLIYKSEGGVFTRSKAEADIATKLEQYQLAFRYDEVIVVGNRRMSPDFSVLHPRERRVKYWEHFGRMDDPRYVENAMDKLCHYSSNGINLGDNLIVTWENRGRPLLFEQINACIREHFL